MKNFNSLELIKNADKDEIKKLYREGMTKSNIEGPGAGPEMKIINQVNDDEVAFILVQWFKFKNTNARFTIISNRKNSRNKIFYRRKLYFIW